MQKVLSVILGGGRGTRLYPLTKVRAKPAVPIGGKYRLIDIPISNSLHAGIDKIYVLTQFNSASLHRHIKRTYIFDSFSGGFVDILAAEQTQENSNWYQGTADAVRQQIRHILHGRTEQVLILSGDHLYRMDYCAFVEEHRRLDADVTIATIPVDRNAASNFGVLKVNEEGHIEDFKEKPQTDADFEYLRLPSELAPREGDYLASMGIYIFKPNVLAEVLKNNSKKDFGRDIIPQAIRSRHVHAYRFVGYWEDVGTIGSFYHANLALTDPEPAFEFYQPDAPIYTRPRYLSGASFDHCHIDCATIGDGSVINRARIKRSVIGIRSVIGPGVNLANTVMMGADYYETPEELAHNQSIGRPNIGIGHDTVIDGAIIDKNARIGDNVKIVNEGKRSEADGDNYAIRDGIVVVPKSAVIASGTVI